MFFGRFFNGVSIFFVMSVSPLHASLCSELDSLKSEEKRLVLSSFFKTGKGEYGEGDVFLGITVPVLRKVMLKYVHLSFSDIDALLKSPIHEHRLVGCYLLVWRFKHASVIDIRSRIEVYEFYVDHFLCINNWDLVDTSCSQIVGAYMVLVPADRKWLFVWATSLHLWTRRIAVVSCYAFIRLNQFDEILRLCSLLLTDSADLMHKACGWMLREVGKRDMARLCGFLDEYALRMPRTMLRYSVERLSLEKRKYYMSLKEKV